ncbi:uncharacterized protein LOC141816701 [Curcuma longa]|uniref:uncharacterized protein LOC141816701 n=1 Tax=Curcuma longa TaxID=136217 RepID=UPI003D9E012C
MSLETPSRDPEPAAAAATAAAEEPVTVGGRQGGLLHDLSFPILKTRGGHRVVSCMGKENVGAAGGPRLSDLSETSNPRIRLPSSRVRDVGVEEVRERLLAHLREAADRMKLVLPEGYGDDVPAPAKEEMPHREASDASTDLPWNLRTRHRAAGEIERHRYGSPPPPTTTAKRKVGLRSDDPKKKERPRFSISLTREEIDEDIYAVTGCRARRRPRKRPRVVQKQLETLFPGSWLSEITADAYRILDER